MPKEQVSNDVVLNLEFQGEGTYRAFTWGVLERLLKEPGITPGRISVTSAGALNGAALATGYARGGPAGAKVSLAALGAPHLRGACDLTRTTASIAGAPSW